MSFSELLLILVVALLVIKPEHLPEVAYGIGRFAQSVRKFFSKLQQEVNGFIDSMDKQKEINERQRDK